MINHVSAHFLPAVIRDGNNGSFEEEDLELARSELSIDHERLIGCLIAASQKNGGVSNKNRLLSLNQ